MLNHTEKLEYGFDGWESIGDVYVWSRGINIPNNDSEYGRVPIVRIRRSITKTRRGTHGTYEI